MIMQTLMHLNNLENRENSNNGASRPRSRFGTNYFTMDPEVMLGTFPNMVEEQNFFETGGMNNMLQIQQQALTKPSKSPQTPSLAFQGKSREASQLK